ncbi:MAG TPA: HEAT repeat domain-containing protein [Blastocatellia bacterium]|nr:HEAT repeat domain-containing protein [Blastocatellia bacterium]
MKIETGTYVRVLLLGLSMCAAAGSSFAAGPSLETLLAYLKSPNPITRRDAAHKLGERRVHDQVAVEALAVAARKDDDAAVRSEALQSLGMIKSFSALNEMLDALKDTDPDVRRIAVKSLVMLYTEHDIDFITNRRIGWNRLNPFLDTDDHEIIEPYVMVDPSIIIGLGETARRDSDRSIRVAAIRALGVLKGRDAIPQLAEALQADQEVRLDVIRTFIKIGDQAAGHYLIPFFTDSDQKVRTQAMFAAGMLKYRPAIQPLLAVYGLGPQSKGPVTAITHKIKGRFEYLPPRDEAALWALSLIGDSDAELVFAENMDSSDGDRRQYAIEGLARVGDRKYLDQISRLILTEKKDDVKLAMEWAMYKMGRGGQIQDIARHLDSGLAEHARQYLMEPNNPADLYPYLESSNSTVRMAVIDILGHIGNMETVGVLKPVVDSSGRKTSDAATVAIKQIEWRISGRPRATDEILGHDQDGSARPRRVGSH